MGPCAMRDRLGTAVVWCAALGVTAIFLWIVGDLVVRGAGEISWAFLTEAPSDAGRSGERG